MTPILKATKAQVAAGLTFVVTFVNIWIADTGSFTPKEIAAAAIAGVVSAGIIGVPTYKVTNKPKYQ